LDPFEQSATRGERNHLVQRGIDSLGDRFRTEDLACLSELVTVDDERSLVPFGYRFSHLPDILKSPKGSVQWRF